MNRRHSVGHGRHRLVIINDLGMSANALAKALDVPANRITAILNGQRAITADTALRLARFFGVSAQFWLNLQQSHDLKVAERTAGKKFVEPCDRAAPPERRRIVGRPRDRG